MTLYRESVISRNIIEELYREKHLLKNHCREILSKKTLSKKFIEKSFIIEIHYRENLSKKLTFIENFYREIEDFEKLSY